MTELRAWLRDPRRQATRCWRSPKVMGVALLVGLLTLLVATEIAGIRPKVAGAAVGIIGLLLAVGWMLTFPHRR